MVEVTEGGIRLGPDWLFHIELWKHPWHKTSEVQVYQIFNDSTGEFVGSFAYVTAKNKYLSFWTEYEEDYTFELWATFREGLAWVLREKRLKLENLDI